MLINRSLLLKFVVLSLSVIIMFALSMSGYGGEGSKYGGTAVFRIQTGPTYFIVHGAADNVSRQVSIFLNDHLVRLNLNNEWEGFLAESWSISEDGLTYTFNLRQDAKWHDGVPITADDVIFTYELIMNEEACIPFREQQFIGGKPIRYEKVTDYQFKIILPEVFAPLFSYLIVPIPKHIWENVPASDYLAHSISEKYISSGPFKFVEYKTGEYLKFEAFEDYYKGRPYLDSVIFSIIPDWNSAAVALESGQIDFTSVLGDTFSRLEASDRMQTFKGPSGNVRFVALNNSVFPFDDVRVRKALSHLTNKEVMANQVMLGYAEPAYNFMVPSDMYYNEDVVVRYEYDVEKAKQLLADAGFTPGSDGVLEKDGKRMEFEVLFKSGDAQLEQAVLILQSDFNKAGIKLTPRGLEWSAIVNIIAVIPTRPRPYEAALAGNTLGPDPTKYRYVYQSASDSYMEYINETVDQLFDAGDQEIDFEKRRQIYEELQTLITDDAPAIWLWYIQTLYGASPRLRLEEAELTGLEHLRFLKPGKIYIAQ